MRRSIRKVVVVAVALGAFMLGTCIGCGKQFYVTHTVDLDPETKAIFTNAVETGTELADSIKTGAKTIEEGTKDVTKEADEVAKKIEQLDKNIKRLENRIEDLQNNLTKSPLIYPQGPPAVRKDDKEE